jgi:hypothetical protein
VTINSEVEKVRFRGVWIATDPHVVRSALENGLHEDPTGAARFQGWFVEIAGMKIAPKWLVSRLTSLPVSAFHSDDARRLLAQLGVEVRRL